MKKYLLAIESSCDDTAVAIIDDKGTVFADLVYGQVQAHAPFGGVVPEIASREHLQKIPQAVSEAIKQAGIGVHEIKAVAVTSGPGLIGSLLVGVQFARGFAASLDVPLIGIHHIEGHLMASSADPRFPTEPFIALIASGGHSALYLCKGACSYELLGETKDDAAGEAFDKMAKLLGYGYPGGKIVDELAQKGDSSKFKFPVAFRTSKRLDFSFSGLKTSFRLKVHSLCNESGELPPQTLYDLCASVQKAVVEALLAKTFMACERHGIRHLVLGGGVAANSALRSQALQRGEKHNIQVFLPPHAHCTDNAVMIALAAKKQLDLGLTQAVLVNAHASLTDKLC